MIFLLVMNLNIMNLNIMILKIYSYHRINLKYIFELKTNKTMEDLFETSYFIFDEFDSLYDPLKSAEMY